MQVSENHQRYWQKNLRITAILLSTWFVVTFVVGFYARDLNFDFFGWPFSFWMGAQGSLVIYLVIIGYYSHYMNKLDQEHGVAEEE
jgi:putative solute:sodium symporter small subunit